MHTFIYVLFVYCQRAASLDSHPIFCTEKHHAAFLFIQIFFLRSLVKCPSWIATHDMHITTCTKTDIHIYSVFIHVHTPHKYVCVFVEMYFEQHS